ncbi:transcriptional regulator [Kibdelosporangium phytohabitans]|uniref:Transcriptional regulator n=1 Tax=Kibdelosporangium phytohabitans TaxID=860235 RepID=A0A0N9HK27_9PSEU|nr:transcriptional regulator [Kibdelosporangium phytohabitans]
MGRRAEVFVRPLEPEEAQRLVKVTRSTRDRVRLRRAGIVLASMQGRGAADIAVMFAATDSYVREVIHAFNDLGFAALDPKWSGGRPRKFGPAARQLICRIAQANPAGLGQPFTTWSLTKLAAYLAEHHWLRVSTETIRQILRAAGITWQRTKTWKASQDPDFAAKMARILALYDDPPADGRVVCVDEFGPLNLLPRPGHGWFPRGHPARRRATYTRTAGVRQMFAALDLATGQLFYRFRDRKRWQEFLEFCKQLRRRFPSGWLYLICDNYGSHHKAEVTAWCADHDIELVFTPSNASWLNWIECEFTALRYFTLDGSDYPSHTAQESAIARYIRWANKHPAQFVQPPKAS